MKFIVLPAILLLSYGFLKVESMPTVLGEWVREGNSLVKCDIVESDSDDGDSSGDSDGTTTPTITCVAKLAPITPPPVKTLWDMIAEVGDVRFKDTDATSSGVLEIAYIAGADFVPLCISPMIPFDNAGADTFCKKLGFTNGGVVANGADFEAGPCVAPGPPLPVPLQFGAVSCTEN